MSVESVRAELLGKVVRYRRSDGTYQQPGLCVEVNRNDFYYPDRRRSVEAGRAIVRISLRGVGSTLHWGERSTRPSTIFGSWEVYSGP